MNAETRHQRSRHPSGRLHHLPAFADHLNVQDKSVRKWIKAGLLPAYRFVGEVRIAKADAIAFIERARFQS